MESFDPIDIWINNMAYSHSGSKSTDHAYRHDFQVFSEFIGKTAREILKEYEQSEEREFKRKYAAYLRAFISSLSRKDYTPMAIRAKIMAVKSFFKYSDLPLGNVPIARKRIIYHNRDIAREEIIDILKISRPRDRAFFCMMAQTGLRPYTLCKLKLKHLEPDFSQNIIPCKIEVPQEIAKGQYRSYFTFMGEESIKHLRSYLATRGKIGSEDYVFTSYGTNRPAHPRSMSTIFKRAIESLKEKGLIDFKQEKRGKPRTVHLYNLRKFFRKYSNQAGFEIVQFWMGHIVNEGQDEHYRPRDPEWHRKQYEEKAMPFLRLEIPTPTETDKMIQKQAQEIADLNARIEDLETAMLKTLNDIIGIVGSKDPEAARKVLQEKVLGLETALRKTNETKKYRGSKA